MLRILLLMLAMNTAGADSASFASPAAKMRADSSDSNSLVRMAPMRSVSIAALLESAKRRNAADVVALLETARDALGLETARVSGHGTEQNSMDNFDANAAAMQLGDAIRRRESWEAPLSPAGAASLRKHRELLLKAFAPGSPFESRAAWIHFQLGEKAEAKKILAASFEKKFAEVMAMKGVDSGFGETPLMEPEFQARGLRALSTEAELAPVDAKLQKMKTHVSNLPNYQIMT